MLKTFTNEELNNVHAYLLINDVEHKAVLIDTAGIAATIIDYLKENALTLTDIFITHFHFDHTFSLEILQKAYHPIIHIAKEDFLFLFDKEFNGENRLGTRINLKKDDNFDLILEPESHYNINAFDFKVIKMGGHTPGATFYVVNDEYAFVGDTLFKEDIGFHNKTYPPIRATNTCDDEKFYASIDYIIDNFKDYLICPGHHTELFRVGEIITNEDHPYHKMREI